MVTKYVSRKARLDRERSLVFVRRQEVFVEGVLFQLTIPIGITRQV
jgi:hypothetical protein